MVMNRESQTSNTFQCSLHILGFFVWFSVLVNRKVCTLCNLYIVYFQSDSLKKLQMSFSLEVIKQLN